MFFIVVNILQNTKREVKWKRGWEQMSDLNYDCRDYIMGNQKSSPSKQ